MIIWVLLSNNYIKVFQRNQVNAPSDVRLAKSLMDFEFQPCGIFEDLLHYQEDEAISPTTFADYL